jgi:tRNA modification GTPase
MKTIAAIATPPGQGGISIIRIAGNDALKIADRIFQPAKNNIKPSQKKHGSFIYGHIINPKLQSQIVDEAILLVYRAPNSYTREDTVEIQGHGGIVCAEGILQTAIENGAVSAAPGEFTKRAFLNGRIDLVQAEAVMDLINADSRKAANAAMEQLDGHLSDEFNKVYDELMNIAANIEATFDFVEHELPNSVMQGIIQSVEKVRKETKELIETWNEGHLLRDGVLLVISGKPNAGKSTLFNKMLGFERAIVTNVAGTTRDTIEEKIIISGISFRLVDTAGIRESDCHIEKEGVSRALNIIDRADINIYIADISREVTVETEEHIERLPKDKSIIILNKIDNEQKFDTSILDGFTVIKTSLKNKTTSLADLNNSIIKMVGINPNSQPHAVISLRHKNILQNISRLIDDVEELVKQEDESQLIFAAGLLREAIELAGEITGKIYHKSLLDNIFGRFCIGK